MTLLLSYQGIDRDPIPLDKLEDWLGYGYNSGPNQVTLHHMEWDFFNGSEWVFKLVMDRSEDPYAEVVDVEECSVHVHQDELVKTVRRVLGMYERGADVEGCWRVECLAPNVMPPTSTDEYINYLDALNCPYRYWVAKEDCEAPSLNWDA